MTIDGNEVQNTEDEEWLAEQYATEVRVACEAARARTGRQSCVRAFIAESMQSCGGQIVYQKSFLERARVIVAEFGGVLILDEVCSFHFDVTLTSSFVSLN